FEVVDGRLDVVGQIALGLTQVVDLGSGAVDACLEDGIEREVRIGIGRNRTNLSPHGARVADGNANHRAAICCGGLDLVRSLEVRIETTVCIDARVEYQTDVQGVR